MIFVIAVIFMLKFINNLYLGYEFISLPSSYLRWHSSLI